MSDRRTFLRQASLLLAGTQTGSLFRIARAADAGTAIAETASGKVRGTVVEEVNIFKGIPYGGNPVTCPVRAVKTWIEAAQLAKGSLFREVGASPKA